MRTADKKVTYASVKERITVDGDIDERETDYSYRVPTEPEFVKMYCDDVANLNSITGVEGAVLRFMASMMDYNNKVILSPAERKRWQLQLAVAQSTINNAISTLAKDGHIRRISAGEYIVCPTMFSKGEWKKTMQKRESFDAHFTIRYERTKTGYTRTFREAKVKPIGMKVDLETGEQLYKYKKGGEFEKKRHDDLPEMIDGEECPY